MPSTLVTHCFSCYTVGLNVENILGMVVSENIGWISGLLVIVFPAVLHSCKNTILHTPTHARTTEKLQSGTTVLLTNAQIFLVHQ
jgi:hypothetical protein